MLQKGVDSRIRSRKAHAKRFLKRNTENFRFQKNLGAYAAAAFGRAGDGGTVALTVTNFYNCGKVTGKNNAGFLVGNVSSGWDVTNATKKDVLQDADGNNVPFPTCAFTNCINDGEIGGGVMLGVINNPVTLKDCASTFEGDAYQNAPNVTIISEVSDVAAAKAALLALLPADVTELTELVIESEDMFADDYKSGWDAYEAAISDAKAAINQAIDVATATEVLEAVKTAKTNLVPIDSVNFDALNDAIAEADTLVNTDDKVYTPATWAAFDAARAAAKEVAGATKQSTVNKALNALVAAMDALEKIPDIAALNAAIATAEALTEADYVTATWAALAEIVAKAKVIAADENATNAQVEGVMADMAAATAALDKKVDTAPLATKVTETEKAYPRDTYTAMSYGKLTTAIREAQNAAASNDIGQATLNALSKAIDDAVAGLAKRATFADIDALLATTEALVETDFTPDSWKVYEEALEEVNNAKKEDKKPNVSVDDEAKLLEKLTAAVNGLVPYATYDALNALVKEVNAMDKAKYTVESWAAVEAAIAKVDELKSNRYATQPEADAILAEINAAVDALVEATAGGDNTTAETDAPATGNNDNKTDDTTSGGCGGFIATTAVVMASVLALGAAVVAKKKED